MSELRNWLRNLRTHEKELEDNRRMIEEQIKKDPTLKQPLLFPHHQKQVKYFGIGVCAVVATGMVLFVDFGEEDHIFTPLRKVFRSSMSSIFGGLSSEDKAAAEEKIKELKQKLSTTSETEESS